MKFAFSLLFLVVFFLCGYGQSSRLAVKGSNARKFAKQITESVLVVPVGGETDPEEKALIAAVKKYWKVSKYEFVPGKDFETIYNSNIKEEKNCMYLVRESYDRRKTRKKDWSFTKYYISVNPSFVEFWGDPYLQFKLPVKAVDKANAEPVNCEFLYGLMMKHLNREVLYMQDRTKYGKVSKSSLYKATFEGDLIAYAERDLLVSRKELDNFMMNLTEKRKTKEQETKFLEYLSERLKVKQEKIRFVSDEYIKRAVDSEDKRVLVYTGFSVYRGEDAAMLRRIDPYRSSRIAANIKFTVGLISACLLFLLLLNNF